MSEHDADALVREYLPMAQRVASRYAGRGEPVEDLLQVARLGLVKAAQRFDEALGVPFPAYAVPTMLGELRRYFRDSCWAVRVPRGLQELTLRVGSATERLSRDLGRSPTPAEVAAELDISVDDVVEALECSYAYSTTSLDAQASDDAGGSSLGEQIGAEDTALDDLVAREALRRVIAAVPARERRILTLRFYGERTQAEIAAELGISQMHVSRLIARTLSGLRDHLVEGAPLPPSWSARDPHAA